MRFFKTTVLKIPKNMNILILNTLETAVKFKDIGFETYPVQLFGNILDWNPFWQWHVLTFSGGRGKGGAGLRRVGQSGLRGRV